MNLVLVLLSMDFFEFEVESTCEGSTSGGISSDDYRLSEIEKMGLVIREAARSTFDTFTVLKMRSALRMSAWLEKGWGTGGANFTRL